MGTRVGSADCGLYHLNKQRLAVLHVPKAFAEADAKLRDAVEKMVEQRTAELADLELHAASRKVLESLKRHWSGLTIFADSTGLCVFL